MPRISFSITLAALVALAGGCVVVAPQPVVQPQSDEYRGRYELWLDASAFHPCDAPKSERAGWQVVMPASMRLAAGVELPKRGSAVHAREYFVRWRGVPGPQGRFGRGGEQPRQFTVVELLEVRKPAANDCAGKRVARAHRD